jgi:tetratricopeptide (TPR) repeat protein
MTQPVIPQICHLLIKSLERQRKADDALQVAKDWAQHFPADAMPHYALGRLALQQRDYPLALRELEIASRLEPERREIVYKHALALYKLNQLDKATTYAKLAVKLDRRERRRREMALKELAKASESAGLKAPAPPSSGKGGDAVAMPFPYLLLARIHIRKSEWKDALSRLDEYLVLRPNDINAQLLRAICEQNAGAQDDAYTHFADTIALVAKRAEEERGRGGFSKFSKENPTISKKLSGIQSACASSGAVQNANFTKMCEQLQLLKQIK